METAVHWHIRHPVLPSTAPRRAVFLDRDGVITEDTGYLHRPEEVRLLPGAVETVSRINQLGVPVILVTNQSGIGRGLYGWQDFERVQARIRQELAQAGAWLDAEFACGYYSPSQLEFAPGAGHFRKPEPGMLEQAAAELALGLPDSWLVGDKPSDIETAIRAGLQGAVHVLTGYGAETRDEVIALSRRNQSRCEIHLAGSIADLLPLLGSSKPSPR
jgi:D-glycero-D-manno-heptose 1,7-bisphosphate phosphatase